MRPPLRFVYGNVCFARSLDDAWALFALAPHAYDGLTAQGKHERLGRLLGALETLAADVQLVRVEPAADSDDGAPVGGDSGPHHDARAAYVVAQRDVSARLGARAPWVGICVRLARARDPAAATSAGTRLGRFTDALRRGVGFNERGLLAVAELERLRIAADRAHERLADFLDVRPARTVEVQWLVRRAFCRGLGEPDVDGLHEPQALVFETNGRAVLSPLEADVLRWADGLIEHRARTLRIDGELGVSHQAQLVLGALPEQASFPGARVELLFRPPESLGFPVDVTLNARFIANDQALRLVRRRIQDADQILRAEGDGDQGASDQGYERTQQARDLLGYLQSPSRPALLRASIALAVGAPDEAELERRVEALRRAYGEVRLHRPFGDQLELFCQHLPAQPSRVAGYDDVLTCEQVAAMMPSATHAVGSRRGFLLGHTLTGSRRPVRFDPGEGSATDRPAAILCVGSLGSGKTLLTQKLLYEGFLNGARIVDVDPKGDHHFHLLEDVAPHFEQITLAPDPSLRGLLDPLRVAPAHLRQDATVGFLCDLLPVGCDAAWISSLVRGVDTVLRYSDAPTCHEVLNVLRNGDATDAQVARALSPYAESGLAQLGFAAPEFTLPALGAAQVTHIAIRDLPAPAPQTPRSEYSQSERVAEQVMRLVALYAMQLLGSERDRLKLYAFDEGWRLLRDATGRALLDTLGRMGRSELAVPIIATQLVEDMSGERGALDNLIGATFVFGMRSDAEARRALALLGLDPDDEALRARLLDFAAGRCLMRDHRGRVEAIQVDVAPKLLEALSTTPRAHTGDDTLVA